MSERKDLNHCFFFKKVLGKVSQGSSDDAEFYKIQESLENKRKFTLASSEIHDTINVPVNNNWIVGDWFKTWPIRDKLSINESLPLNLSSYSHLIKKNVVSLDVITDSDNKSYLLSTLRSIKQTSVDMNGHKIERKESPEGTVSLDALLESLPLVYNPSTKQLQVGNCHQKNKKHTVDCYINPNAENPKNKENFSSFKKDATNLDEKCMLLHEESISNKIPLQYPPFSKEDFSDYNSQTHVPSFSFVSKDSPGGIHRVSTSTSLSSFSSSNTDLSLADNAVCMSGDVTSLHEISSSKKKKGLGNFIPRSLFSWKSKESVDRSSLEENATAPASGWKIFSRSSDSFKRKATGVKAGTVGLIMEGRPSHLPAKTAYEEEKHKLEYETIVLAAKKKEAKEAKEREKLQAVQRKLEQQRASSVYMWNNVIIPKWETMHKQKKPRELWWLGIPSCVRGKVWKLAIGNKLGITSDLYSKLVQRSKEKLVGLPVVENSFETDQESTIDLIGLDVSRTFPHLCIFQKGGPFHDPLQNILGAFVLFHPAVGYVQGMSFLAAVLLLNMSESEAFIAFANLLTHSALLAFYNVDQHLMQAYYKTLEDLTNENLPLLSKHLKKLCVTPDLYFLDWVLTLFSRSLPLDISVRIWDIYLRDKEEFLFKAAIGILKHFENELLSQDDTVMSAQLLTRLPDHIDQELLFKSISAMQISINGTYFAKILDCHIKKSVV